MNINDTLQKTGFLSILPNFFTNKNLEFIKDYKFCDDIKMETVPIQILTEKFKGVIYRYTNIFFKDDGNILDIEFDVCDEGIFKKEFLIKDEEFKETIKKILNNIIINSKKDKEK